MSPKSRRAATLEAPPLDNRELADLRDEVARWNPRCAFTVLGDRLAASAVYECGVVRANHDPRLDGHVFVERPSDRLTVRRLLATIAASRATDLQRYGEHRPDCRAWGSLLQRQHGNPSLPEKCNCGLVAALERANAR